MHRAGPHDTDLFHFAQMQGVFVVCPELHEAHVRTLWQLGDALDAWKESLVAWKKNEYGKNKVEEEIRVEKEFKSYLDSLKDR